MAALLKDAIKPTLLQTTEATPVLVHAGPFANIAHGNSSILADKIALKLADYVVTESGFGADCGMEKFCNIKCRASGLVPDCAVMVCTIRALKAHSGKFKIKAGKPLPEEMNQCDLESVTLGAENLKKQIQNAQSFGIPVVVAINRFYTDHDEEIELVKKLALEFGANDAVLSEVWEKGGQGGVELANAVTKACNEDSQFQMSYPDSMSIKEKMETIAKTIYGANGIELSSTASKQIKLYTKLGYGNLPVCMAKTQFSLSHDPSLKGRPEGFTVPVKEIRLSAGAGFLIPVCGDVNLMPGLSKNPAACNVDIDEEGNISGLF
jgi:formyltetrahydrofolate synthetase